MKSIVWLAVVMVCISSANAEEIGVRIRFGLKDKEPTKWNGTVSVEPGKVTAISGWRFGQSDKIDGTSGWETSTRPVSSRRRSNRAAKAKRKGSYGPIDDNGVTISLAGVFESSRVNITTSQGRFSFALSDVPHGKVLTQLDGAVEVERSGTSMQLTTQRSDDDYPAAAVAGDGTVYVAYVSFTPGLDRDERARTFSEAPADFSYLATPPGGDRVWLHSRRDGKWSEPIAVTAGKGDIYKCAVAVDGSGAVWVIWSERKEGHFDIWARSGRDGRFDAPQRLSTDAGNDVSPVATTDANGRVWVAWQGARDNVFRILARRQTSANAWSDEMLVSTQSRSCWTPAIAATSQSNGGRVAVAWDTYEKGDYDIYVREYDLSGAAQQVRPVANTPRYEARPSATYDHDKRLWIAWEESGPTWGKNWGALVRDQGIPLYQDRYIGMRVLADGVWQEPLESFGDFLPGARPRRGVQARRVPAIEPEGESRQAAQEAQTRAGQPYNNISRLATDRDGRIWMLVRSRANDFRVSLGSVWVEYAAFYEGGAWTGPILIPNSDNLIYNLPAAVAAPDGGLVIAYSSDHRQRKHVVRLAGAGNASLGSNSDPYDNDVFISHLAATPREMPALRLKPATETPEPHTSPAAATVKEREEIARTRAYRAKVGGSEYRILRGEFHRHTEISGDGGNDGPLEDMWRYAMDVAGMDWIGCGDHDNGGGREYPWWLTQKTTDAFQLPGSFDPLFTYERSVRYPEGHRNVVFPRRGIRTLPRLPISDRNNPQPAPDTQMLYRYLHHFDGICAVHTSATRMGTDWRDNDPVVEPFVEIYQGCRQNYERPDAPRAPTEDDAIGGWEPLGFVNLALKKGYRLSFQSSSDHRSTHISYCLVYAEDATRQSIFDAMKARRTYGATDNIIADLRCTDGGKEHFMGEEFAVKRPPTLRLMLHGTAPFAKVVIVKDDQCVHTITPNAQKVDLTWTDPNPTAGKTSYYYVRGEQADEELVWVSPMWIKYEPGR